MESFHQHLQPFELLSLYLRWLMQHGDNNMNDPLTILQSSFDQMQIIDLSHTLEPAIPSWPTHPKYCHNLMESYTLGEVSCHYQLTMGEHTGTHFDAPLHFIAGGSSIADIPLEKVMGRAATIQAEEIGPNGVLTSSHIMVWEEQHGEIQANDIVLLHFGWDRLWQKRPHATKFLKDWPGLNRNAAEYLVAKKVTAVVTDALSIDVFTTTDFPAHYTLLSHQVLIGENFTNLWQLPPFSLLMAFPLKIQEGSGSPVRAVAFVPRNQA